MSFEISLYVTKEHRNIEYPISEDYNWHILPMFNQREWLPLFDDTMQNLKFYDTHDCREVACNKGASYDRMRTTFGNIFTDSMILLESDMDIPTCFRDVVETYLLDKYGCVSRPEYYNEDASGWMDITKPGFSFATRPSNWNVPWTSLLLYFVKYGEFLTDLVGGYNGAQVTLDETIEAIMQSWSGEVGFHTAFGLWLFANNNAEFMFGNKTWHSGISSYLARYHTIFYPDSLFSFLSEYGLGADCLSKAFLKAHRDRVVAAGYSLPQWFLSNRGCNGDISDSPEFRDYMGYDDYEDEDDYYEDYDDDFDFEEEEW